MANSPGRAIVDVGSVIADTYTLEALLGRGGMGAVFLASHKRLAGKQVAIKILHTELEDADIVARFKREAEIAAKLNHPNIVGVVDYNVTPDGMPYLVLDYLEGETLAQKIARGPMPLDQVTSILRQVGSALAAAHRGGIVHRDLKPQNIFLVPTEVDGRWVEIAKVLDFGISKIRGSQTVKTQDSTLLGTPQYMAPEQATGQHALIDERTDEFALGAIAYEMLTGMPAFSGSSIPEVVFKVVYEQPVPLGQIAPNTPPSIIDAVGRAMAKPPDERFATVTLFVEAVTGQPLSVTRGAFPAQVPLHDSPSGSGRRVTTSEAFDRTMGSAAGVAPVNPMLATMPPPQTGAAASMAQGTANARLPIGTANAALVAPVSVVAAAPPAKRRTGLIIGLAVVAAAAVAVAVVFALKTPPHTPPTEPIAVNSPGPVTPPAPPAPPAPPQQQTTPPAPPPGPTSPTPPAPPTEQTKPPTEQTKPPTPGKVTTKPAHPPVAPPVAAGGNDAVEDGDDDTRDKLQKARAALQGHNYDDAERLANAVINSAAGPRARAQGHLIRGTVACESRNDQEAAQIELRALSNFPAQHGRLAAICKKHGVIQ